MELTFRNVLLSEVHPDFPEVTILGTRLVQDSREVTPESIFVAMGSTGASGHAYAAEALSRGARAVLVDSEHMVQTLEDLRQLDVNSDDVVAIPQLHHNMGIIASAFWGNPSSHVSIVGITGTNGKTSAVQMLCQAWAQLGHTCASVGTLGAGIFGEKLTYTGLTTPPVTRLHELLAQYVTQGVTHVAIELSSHALVQGRADGVLFSQVAFTNLSHDHLDFHHTMEKYAQAKEKIFDLPTSPDVVLNLDDEVGRAWWKKYHENRNVLGVSSQGSSDAAVEAHDIDLKPEGFSFTLSQQDEKKHVVTTHLMGRFNVDNALIVAGVLLAEGNTIDQIATTLSHLEPVFGRMNRIQVSLESPLVVVDYAHTPDALSQALNSLKLYSFSRIITVFGCTGDRDVEKRPEMAKIAEELSDIVIVTDDDVHFEDGDLIVKHIREGFVFPDQVVELRDRAKALRHAISEAESNDVVFVAGKGHEEYLIVGDDRVPFSDSDLARQLLDLKIKRKL